MNVFILGFQLALSALVLLSFLMLIFVPVVFASPDGLTNNKNYILLSVILWTVLVLTVGVLNFFVV
uniref:Photosystem II reaction center protein Z n=1 Tax=Lepocinclis playfairiana TaxID=1403386 RepID=A0A3G3LLJ9_9EUGL|nr:photosystem II protein Z [Lepocinclis playfairiana]AYQ93578.1 photosystem II protein Z [Lepocinclis playfairiana]